MKKFLIISFAIYLCHQTYGQGRIVEDFTQVFDTLAVQIEERTGVKGEIKANAVMKRGNSLDFYFTETLSDFPWRKRDIKWLRTSLKAIFPEEYKKYRLGEIYSRKVNFEKLVMPEITYNGMPAASSHRKRKPSAAAMVRKIGGQVFAKGLQDSHIALWQSHGRYYSQSTDKWEWQRPCLFQTCEDMFTQGFVLPYLVPMLENAGAYILMPRERDLQKLEIIADNDTTAGGRGSALYQETGRWESMNPGFADTRPVYEDLENPFTMGSARMTASKGHSDVPDASARWTPDITRKGEYAVYISYRTMPNSTSAAHYTVKHLGGISEFAVNQKMGGGTWIYLGTFEFGEGCEGYVSVDNTTPKGYRHEAGSVVTADAVKFGGGMGNIARSRHISPEDSLTTASAPSVSGMPRSAEAARYWLQWAGADSTVYYQFEGKDDYKDDFCSRGDWVEWISRGSWMNPDTQGGLGIPVDLSLGFHSDAGVTQNDSIVGTLAIYTYRSEGSTVLPSGEDRLTGRMYADMVQTQIVNDMQSIYDTLWTRRSIWDRAYRESRTPSSPSMILELLSHQNFSDMKYGLDPSFRFDASRAVYKGMLKYLSSRYGHEYAVQPLPVDHIGVKFTSDSTIVLSWRPVSDPLEPTAEPSGYMVYRRIGDGVFDKGVRVTDHEADSTGHIRFHTYIPKGEVVSFKVAAYNDGGLSFPSETVSVGIPSDGSIGNHVLIVNNFDRVSGPVWFNGPERAGFDNRKDSGVAYIRDITHIGEMYNFNQGECWESNEKPGFGASYCDMAGEAIAGNTFDYASVHGRMILKTGTAFTSCSNERFIHDRQIGADAWAIDLICGKQLTTHIGKTVKYQIFPEGLQNAIRDFTSDGGNVLISGAYIGTDSPEAFTKEILGYRHITGQASRRCKVIPVYNGLCGGVEGSFRNEMNPESYCVESPDGITPADKDGRTICRYSDSGISAGVAYQGKGYRTVCLGFPVEIMEDEQMVEKTIRTVMEYFKK